MVDGVEEFGGLLWLLVPPDMLQCGDADDEVIFLGRGKLYDILIDHAWADFVLVDDIVGNREIVSEDISHFENPFAFMVKQQLTKDRDLDSTLVFPGSIIGMIQVLIVSTIELEGFGSGPTGERHLEGAPVPFVSALTGCLTGVVVGIGHEGLVASLLEDDT